jgi:hypothetical protein
MAIGDIVIFREGAFGAPGARKHAVAAGAVASIKAGELVLKTIGDPSVVVWTASNTAKPVVGTDFIAGLSATTSTDTASAVGSVDIIPNVPGMVYLGNPTVAADWDTQAEYDALVGNQVRLTTSSTGVQTITNDTHGATYGLVIEPLDISVYKGKVAFSIRQGCNYTA